jgi:ATP-dependent RNA/DNA helicase IGHMBP2
VSINLEEIIHALKAEWEYAKKQHQMLEQKSLVDRIASGLSWPLVMLRSHEYFRRKSLLCFSSSGQFHDGITAGDLVRISPQNTLSPNIIGTCREVYGNSCVIECPTNIKIGKWLDAQLVVITKTFDDRTFETYFKGVQHLLQFSSPLKQAILHGFTTPNKNSIKRPWSTLNDSQKIAAQQAVDSDHLMLIHGPPGTGKTHTTIALAKEFVAQKNIVWLLADSNAATDHLATSALQNGIDILRIGSHYRIKPEILPHSLSSQVHHHPHQKSISLMVKELDQMSHKSRGAMYKEIRGLKHNIRRQIISNHQVFVSTLGSIGRHVSFLPECDVVIIDEATQAIAPAILSVIPYVKKCILIGDPNQLGPVVQMPGNLLHKDLFSLLLRQSKAPMLMEQRRMNDQIMKLVQEYYGTHYISHKSVATQKVLAEGFCFETAIVWIDTVGSEATEEKDPITFSLFNQTEISIVRKVVTKLVESIALNQVAIITPYSAQKNRLVDDIPGVDCNSVNAFQGQEREIVICSFVRCNPDGEIGFVNDFRRLIVSVTRAKSLWIGVGDSATLGQHKAFSKLFDRLEQSNTTWQTTWDWIDS